MIRIGLFLVTICSISVFICPPGYAQLWDDRDLLDTAKRNAASGPPPKGAEILLMKVPTELHPIVKEALNQPKQNDKDRAANAAASWKNLLTLAENGNAKAQHAIGLLYIEGRGVTQNYLKASEWLIRAFSSGDLSAAHALVDLAESGIPAAITWLRDLAERGNTAAQYQLGVVLSETNGPTDFVAAHMWFNLAATAGHSRAGHRLYRLARDKMTPEEVIEAQQRASKWEPSN